MSKSKSKNRQVDKTFALARNHFDSADFATAEQLLKQIVAQDAGYAGAYHYLGRIAHTMGYRDHAVPLFQEAVRLEPANVGYTKSLANQLDACNKSAQALTVVQSGITRNPNSRELRKLQGQLQAGGTVDDKLTEARRLAGIEQYDDLLALTRAMLREDESKLEARYYLGMSLLYTGDVDNAIGQLNIIVQRKPQHDEAWGQLGVAYMHKRMPAASIAAHDRALLIKPSESTHHVNAAMAYLEIDDLDRAATYAKQALSLKGDSVAAISLLGRLAGRRGNFDKARSLLRRALQLRPNFKPALASLVDVLLAEGKLRETEWECRRLIAVDPNLIEAYHTLIDALIGQNKSEQALEFAEIGIKKRPEQIPLQNRLAICYNNLQRYSDAIAKYKEILEIAPEYYASRVNLAGAYSITGGHEQAMEYYAEALKSDEATAEHFSGWIFAHLYDPAFGANDILELSKEWARDYHGNVTPYTSWNTSASSGAPLRLGFISGDFRSHPVGFFLESVLGELSRMGVEIYLYSTVLSEDSTSERFIVLADQWYRGYKDNPQTLASKVHEDAVNILVDVSGHTSHNRLSVFARKPAPVQITWLGYLSTSGLDTMDYIIGDPWVTPPDEQDHFVEEPLVLPNTYQCLSEPRDSPEVVELSALGNGFITFGSFNNYAKLNAAVIDLWAQVLNAVDGSKLLLKNQVLTDPEFQKALRKMFTERGVDHDRLLLEPSRSREHILESYGRVDIGLDPFPYTGCTTSFESLWMGVPVITRRGERFLSHAGESIVNNVGMPDWVARDNHHYIQIAAEKASDIQALADIRNNLRDRIMASPLMDSDSFSRQFHDALSGVWTRRLAETPENATVAENH